MTCILNSELSFRRTRRSNPLNCNSEVSREYFKNLPCQPGVRFWSCLSKFRSSFAETKALVERLMKFAIPHTFIVDGSESLGMVCKSERVELFEEMSPDTILDLFELDSVEPVAVRKCSDEMDATRGHCTAISGVCLGPIVRKLCDLEDLVCVQSFCAGSKVPRVFRVCYFSSDTSKPFAYIMSGIGSSTADLSDENMILTKKYCVSQETSSPQCVSLVKVAGKCIEAHVFVASQVMRFIETFFAMRLKNVVVDIMEDRKVLRVIQVKSFLLAPPNNHRIVSCGSWTRESKLRRMKCLVCGSKKLELSKLVTGKLVDACFRSLKKRVFTMSLLGGRKMSPTEAFKCCDLCYSLIVNEEELKRLSRKFSLCLGFNADINFTRQVVMQHGEATTCCRPHWRVLIGITDMLDVPETFLADAQFSDIEIQIYSNVVIKFKGPNSFQIIDFFCEVLESEHDHDDLIVTVNNSSSGSLSMSLLNKLASLARFSKNAPLTNVPCFLGQGRWSLGILLGVTKETSPAPMPSSCVPVINETGIFVSKNPVGTRPLPESWLAPLAKLKKERRKHHRRASNAPRSRSNSRSFLL